MSLADRAGLMEMHDCYHNAFGGNPTLFVKSG